MRRTFILSLAAATLLALATPLVSQQPAGKPAQAPAILRVTVPENAKLEIDGMKTTQTSSVRLFESPPLASGKKYSYTVKASWMENGKEVTREQTVSVQAGRESAVDLRQAVADTRPAKGTPAATGTE